MATNRVGSGTATTSVIRPPERVHAMRPGGLPLRDQARMPGSPLMGPGARSRSRCDSRGIVGAWLRRTGHRWSNKLDRL